MVKKILLTIVLICFAAGFNFAQKKGRKRESANDKLITALINAEEVRGMYGDDAMYTFTGAPAMEAIFELGEKAIPLLIAHLDDKRLLAVDTYLSPGKDHEVIVTVGAACFDLLTYIIREDRRFFDKECVKDLQEESGEGHLSACANKNFGVFPGDFWHGEKEIKKDLWYGRQLVVKESVRRAKRNWQRAYRKHQIRYVKFDG